MTVANRAARRREAAVNRARGEVTLTVGETVYTLCMTLGAIAEIEDGLGVESLPEIEKKLQTAGSRTFAVLLCALARGGRHEELTVDDVRRWPITMTELSEAIYAAFRGAGAMTDGEAAADSGAPSPGN